MKEAFYFSIWGDNKFVEKYVLFSWKEVLLIFFLNADLDGCFSTTPCCDFVRLRSCFSKISIAAGNLFFLLMHYGSYNTNASTIEPFDRATGFSTDKETLTNDGNSLDS